MNYRMLQALSELVGVVGAAPVEGGYRLDLLDGSIRLATAAEVLEATKAQRIDQINAECQARLISRFGGAVEQVSRSIGIYGAAEKAALSSGIAVTVDASNTASDLVLAASTIAAVEAVTVAWPVI